jgi:hypothetical protein
MRNLDNLAPQVPQTPRRHLARRELLRLAVAAGIGGVMWPSAFARAQTRAVDARDRKLLFVFCAGGGASIIDSFLPIVDSEVGDAELAATLNVFPAARVEQRPGSNIRSVKPLDNYLFFTPPSDMGRLVERHGQDMVVVTHEGTTVNHTVGQQRSLNGNGINRGRTLMEEMALQYGGGLALPSCNMAIDGYVRHGADASVPNEARHEVITTPLLFATGTHGFRALGGTPGPELIARARAVRDQLDQTSVFSRTFAESPRLSRYLASRGLLQSSLEPANLVDKLLLVDNAGVDPKYGLEPSPLAAELRQLFPNMDEDNTQGQIALGFLLAYHGVSASAVMGLRSDPVLHGNDIVGAPIAFDYSHSAHPVTQSLMWGRTTELVDGLISLLKKYDYLGDPTLGKMWDRSLVYVATEFGRDKGRPAGAPLWGTGHHLNNGSIMLSPLLKGNAVYGGVDPKTGLTYGFDPLTGRADPQRKLSEGDVYSIIAQALGLDFPGRRAFDGLMRAG